MKNIPKITRIIINDTEGIIFTEIYFDFLITKIWTKLNNLASEINNQIQRTQINERD